MAVAAAASFAVENAEDVVAAVGVAISTVASPVAKIVASIVAGVVEAAAVATTSTSPMRRHSPAWALSSSLARSRLAGLGICLYQRSS